MTGILAGARHLGSLVEFRVQDDGPGIAPALHDRISEMFQTLEARDTLEGSGMGLAIVKKSVEGEPSGSNSNPAQRGTAFVFNRNMDRQVSAA